MKKTIVASVTFIFLMFITLNNCFSFDYPIIKNERGDTIDYQYPPPDSSYVRNHLIIKFKPNGLILSKLCFQWTESLTKKKNNPLIDNNLISQLMSQRFPVDSIIADSNLRNAIKLFGGDTLRRLTWANPCTDTLSITRLGDTIICNDYLWLMLTLNNDTSVISAAVYLTYLFQNSIDGAEPDYYIKLCRTPIDGYFNNPTKYQYSIGNIGGGINVETAWDYEVGNYNIKIAIIDNGIDYTHCDFGGAMGGGEKVSGGWNYWGNDSRIDLDSDHGTPIAGIIGALTNRNCGTNINSIAGIAGGWYDESQSIDNLGCQLIGLKINTEAGDTNLWMSHAVGAIRAASSKSINPYSQYAFAVDIINLSWIVERDNDRNIYSEFLRSALFYAFENGVSIVCARGNDFSVENRYPACYDQTIITSVGGSIANRTKISGSSWGKGVDLIAPYGYNYEGSNRVYTTKLSNSWGEFHGTSASAPHVSGVLGLLRSYVLNNQNSVWTGIEPEDYEGMLKASVDDITPVLWGDNYRFGYDEFSGWGHLKASNLFNMLNQGYIIKHYTTANTNLTPLSITQSQWSDTYQNFGFYDSFNPNFNKLLPSTGTYKVQVRTWLAEIELPDEWDFDETLNRNLYIWGRSNRTGIGGYSNATPNYQSRYTEIISGTKGLGNPNDPKSILGIFHNNSSRRVIARTYQYKVWDKDNNYLGVFPPDAQIVFNFSAFGLPKTTFISDHILEDVSFNISPNPVNNYLKINAFIPSYSGKIKIILVDLFGNKLIEINDDNYSINFERLINIEQLSTGFYTCILELKNRSFVKIVNVVKL